MLGHPILSTRFPDSHVAASKQIPCIPGGLRVVRGIATEPSYSLVVGRAGTAFADSWYSPAAPADTLVGRGLRQRAGYRVWSRTEVQWPERGFLPREGGRYGRRTVAV